MRNVLNPLLLLLAVGAVDASDNFISPFFDASIGDIQSDHNDTQHAIELLKRQGGCSSGYTNCFNLGAPGLCCKPESVCSADSAGHVGCCPVGAACTGLIGGATGGQTPPSGLVFASSTASSTGFTFATTTNSVQAAGVTPSTVSNPYYPFPYIATTYTDAAACSAAWTGCQTNSASCTAALGGNGYAVTVAAPNGGVTVEAVTTSLPSSAASSVCSSLSSIGCYGLQVAACAAFGNGNAAGATGAAARVGAGAGVYCMGAGVAVGIAGQML
jgi:hypothetical protein